MSKKALNYSKNCFRLKGSQDLFVKDQVLVSFAPYRKNKRIRHTSILPTFNTDRKHYTISFSLPSVDPEPDQSLRDDHDRRVKEAQTQIEEIWYPKPRSRQKYCGVCRAYYEDYMEHTLSERHNSLLKNSQYQALICKSAQDYQQKLIVNGEEWPAAVESFSEEQIFKCLSTESLPEAYLRRSQNYVQL